MTNAEAFLAHHGVLGMHWGQHTAAGSAGSSRSDRVAAKRATRQANDQAIIGARVRQHNRAGVLEKKAFATYTTTSQKGKDAADRAYKKYANMAINHPDEAMANRLTHGEKVATGLWVGAFGAATIALAAVSFH